MLLQSDRSRDQELKEEVRANPTGFECQVKEMMGAGLVVATWGYRLVGRDFISHAF